MSNRKPEPLHPRRTPTTFTIADVTGSERSYGRSRWWVYANSAWLAVGAPQSMTHEEFCRQFREAILMELRPSDDRLVATLRTPIPVGDLGMLATSLEAVYGRGLHLLPFEPGDFARVEFGPRGDPRRTQRINYDEPTPPPTIGGVPEGSDYFGIGGSGTPAFGEPGGH